MNNVVDQASTQVISKRRNARMLAVSVLYDLDINKYYDNNLLEKILIHPQKVINPLKPIIKVCNILKIFSALNMVFYSISFSCSIKRFFAF